MTTSDTIREHVSRDYAEALSKPAPDSCCGTVEQKGVASKLGGYTREELAALPGDAVVNSFGCGNPIAFSEVREGDVVVDLGSGAGIDLLLAAKKVGPTGRVIGVEMTDEMIDRANQNIRASGLTNIEVRKGLIEDMPVETGTVDWVISNCVINLSPEKDRVFAEIARVLKAGGRMSVSDIVVADLPDWVRQSPQLYSGCVSGAISEDEYLDGLREAGLTNVEVTNRIVYDGAQIRAFVASELPGEAADSSKACSCCVADPEAAERISRDLKGKIWSAQFMARRAET